MYSYDTKKCIYNFGMIFLIGYIIILYCHGLKTSDKEVSL